MLLEDRDQIPRFLLRRACKGCSKEGLKGGHQPTQTATAVKEKSQNLSVSARETEALPQNTRTSRALFDPLSNTPTPPHTLCTVGRCSVLRQVTNPFEGRLKNRFRSWSSQDGAAITWGVDEARSLWLVQCEGCEAPPSRELILFSLEFGEEVGCFLGLEIVLLTYCLEP